MNINLHNFQKEKDLFSEIFDIESVFNKFKIEESSNEIEYISLQNIKYSIFYLTKFLIKKKEISKILEKIRLDYKKYHITSNTNTKINSNSDKIEIKNNEYKNINYSYNIIEKTEFVNLINYLLKEKRKEIKICDYDLILEFYKNFRFEEIKFQNLKNKDFDKLLIENTNKIYFDLFKDKILNIFPNTSEDIIKDCFERLDMENLGYIKISALEKFFIL